MDHMKVFPLDDRLGDYTLELPWLSTLLQLKVFPTVLLSTLSSHFFLTLKGGFAFLPKAYKNST